RKPYQRHVERRASARTATAALNKRPLQLKLEVFEPIDDLLVKCISRASFSRPRWALGEPRLGLSKRDAQHLSNGGDHLNWRSTVLAQLPKSCVEIHAVIKKSPQTCAA